MALPRNNSNFNNQNNLYPEPAQPIASQNNYKPLIGDQPLDQSLIEENNTPINQPQYATINPQTVVPDTNYQAPTRFDVQVNPTKTQRAFNKDIRIISRPNRLKHFLAFVTHKWWLILIVVLAISVASLTLWYFLKPSDVRPGPFNQVEATILPPLNSPLGSPSVWKVEIVNKEAVDLLNVELSLEFDPQFRYNRAITPNPSDPKGNKYFFNRIDSVNKNGGTSSVIVEFEGILTGKIDDLTYMQGRLAYTPEPLLSYPDNRNLITLEKIKTVISTPSVTATINPDSTEVEAGTETRIVVNFENLSDKDLGDIRLKMTYPNRSAFEYTSSELQLSTSSSPRFNPSDGNNVWDIATLPADGQQKLIILGKMKGATGTNNSFVLEVQTKRADGIYQNIFTTSKDVKIISRPLLISTEIVGANKSTVFSPGDDLTIKINYKNQGQNILNNVQIVSIINDPAEVLDYSTLEFKNGIIGVESNKTITWGGQSAKFLNNMSPGLEGNIQYKIRVKPVEKMINPTLSQGSYTLIPKVEVTASNIQPVTAQGNTYKATGNVGFSVAKISYKPDPSNPDNRIYTIKWQISTNQNSLKNIRINTSSPLPNTSWQPDSVQPENLTYNMANGQISLQLDELASLYGIDKSNYFIQFDLVVSKQVDSFEDIQLYREVSFTATDSFTGQTYTRSLPSAKTEK